MLLCTQFQELVLSTKDRLIHNSTSKAYEFNTEVIFANVRTFEVRLAKVKTMLITIQQFLTLENAGIRELEDMYASFKQAVDTWKTKPYDLLDFVESGTEFDSDYEFFTKDVAEIELSMSLFVSHTFEELQNIDLALDLLAKLEVILQRDFLKGHLVDKYSLIFQHYGEQLEQVQQVYEEQKGHPPLPRNLPPVAGNILWARHLLTKIEEPMQRFQSNRVILVSFFMYLHVHLHL